MWLLLPAKLSCFYESVVARAIFFPVICWGSSIRASNTKRLNKVIRKVGSVTGTAVEHIELVMERRMKHKLLAITDNQSVNQSKLYCHLVQQKRDYVSPGSIT